MRPISRTALFPLAALTALLGGCSSLPSLSDLTSVTGEKMMGLITPYRVEVVQGNVLTKELVAKVKPGMPRAQVRDLLGSPLLTDAFHEDRWDYVFTIQRQGAAPQNRKVVAWFDGDKLKSLEVPDDLPAENDFVAAINTFKPTGRAPKLSLSEAERSKLPTPPKAAVPVQEPIGAVRTYPPLEPRT